MKVGLYFGSFNPIHHGHLVIANFILQHAHLDQVWFLVSPQNPLKRSATLLNEYHLKASDIEFKLPKPSYTVDTLAYLQEKYPKEEFSVIMGSDSFQNLTKWKNYQWLLGNYPIYVYRRLEHETLSSYPDAKQVEIVDAPLLPISSTEIRTKLKKGQSVRYLLPDSVLEEIEKSGYYR